MSTVTYSEVFYCLANVKDNNNREQIKVQWLYLHFSFPYNDSSVSRPPPTAPPLHTHTLNIWSIYNPLSAKCHMRLIRSERINISLRFGQHLRTSVKLGGKFMDVFRPMGERVLKRNSAFLKVAGSALTAKI